MKKHMDIITNLVESGVSIREISIEFNIPGTTLRRWLNEEGIAGRHLKDKLIRKAKYEIEKRENKARKIKEKEINDIMDRLQDKIRLEIKKELKGV